MTFLELKQYLNDAIPKSEWFHTIPSSSRLSSARRCRSPARAIRSGYSSRPFHLVRED